MSKIDETFCVGILLIDGFPLMSYASVVEPLRAANLLAGRNIYEIRDMRPTSKSVVSSSGAVLNASRISNDKTDFDLLLVVAGGNPSSFQNERVFNWLRLLVRLGVRIGGISGGPVIVASAGLMTGRRMTVHWEHAPSLMEISPSLLVERGLYVIDRDRVTCAGGMAALDLMHAIIAEHHGQTFARQVSDWLLHTDVRSSDRPQRAGRIEQYGTNNRIILNTLEVMENHIADSLELKQLAKISGVSTRQLNRLFHDNMGLSAMRFYHEMRLKKAQNLMSNSSLSLTEIAFATGFASSSHFSVSYSKHYGSPPSSMRKLTLE